MKIEDLLDSTGNYFKKALLTGDYEFVKCGDCTAEILIDGKYTFNVWIANQPKLNFDFYDGFNSVVLFHGHMKLNSQKERMLGWKHMKPHIKEYTDKIIKRQKMEEFNRLKKELETL